MLSPVAGGLDQLVDRLLCMQEVPGSKPGFSIFSSRLRRFFLGPKAAGLPAASREPLFPLDSNWQIACFACRSFHRDDAQSTETSALMRI